MEAIAKISNKVTLKLEFSNQLDLWDKLNTYEEIFGIDTCGACKSDNVRHVIRHVDDPDPKKKKSYDYYELHCLDCRAKLAFGVKQDAEHLFPKRKDENGKYLDNGGWTKWKKEDKEE